MNDFTNNLIKIKYSQEGYLPDYPYHLVSDLEMARAFIKDPVLEAKDGMEGKDSQADKFRYFDLTYPQPIDDSGSPILHGEYETLKTYIKCAIYSYLYNIDLSFSVEIRGEFHVVHFMEDGVVFPIPDWIYSYMLGCVVNNHSTEADRHGYLCLLGLDNMDDIITPQVYSKAYTASKYWVNRYEDAYRPPTMFGEPHIIKAFRIKQVL